MKAQDNVQFPLPEALRLRRGGKWVIEGTTKGQPHADLENKEMHVPLDGSIRSRAIRAHEMGHAQWSPRVPTQALAEAAGVPWIILQSLEDARINTNLKRSGIDLSEGLSDNSRLQSAVLAVSVSAMADEQKLATFASILVASIGSDLDWDAAVRAIRPLPIGEEAFTVANSVKEVIESSRGFVPWRQTVKAARFMFGLMLEEEEEEQDEEDCEGEEGDELLMLGEGDDALDVSDAKGSDTSQEAKPVTPTPIKRKEEDKPKDPKEKEERHRKRMKLISKFSPRPKDRSKKLSLTDDVIRVLAGAPEKAEAVPEWGQLYIETPPLPRRYRELHGNRQRSSSDFGLDLVHVERAYEDGQIFRVLNMGKRRGGSVLIDCSGSMALTEARLRAIIKALPLSIVAVYGGDSSSGVLRIIARRGAMVDIAHVRRPGSGGNIVDGPVLRWLSSQPQPRYWYSDGYVTGAHESQSHELIDDAQNLVIRANIRRVSRIEQITHRELGTHLVPFSFINRMYHGRSEVHDTDK